MVKEFLKEFSKYNFSFVKNYVTENGLDDEEILNLVQKALVVPENLIMHPSPKRVDRVRFLNDLLSYASENGFFATQEFVSQKSEVLSQCESLFDDISDYITRFDIEELPLPEQIWSHIERAELESMDIVRAIEKKREEISSKGERVFSSSLTVKDESGREVSPDAILHHIIGALSLILSLISYRDKLYVNGKSVFPPRVEINESNIFQAGATQMMAVIWKDLELIANQSFLFGGKVRVVSKDKMPKEIKKGAPNIEMAVIFDRKETIIEALDSISHIRLGRKIEQNNFEMAHEKPIKDAIVSDISEISGLGDGRFLSLNEIVSTFALQQIFWSDTLDEGKKYGGLSLLQWVRCYSILRYVCEKNDGTSRSVVIENRELINYFEKGGIEKSDASIFIKHSIFGKDSQDLFDCPLLQLSNGDLCIFSPSLLASNISVIVLSRMASLEIEVDKKGYAFEDEVVRFIREHVGVCKKIKFKRGGQEFECDAVFVLDDKIFVFECKSRSMTWNNPVRLFRKLQDTEQNINQINRLVGALKKYPEVLHDEFGISVEDYEIVPVILNCMPFSVPGGSGGVYFYDLSSLQKFFKSGVVNTLSSSSGEGENQVIKKPAINLWSSERPSAQDFIEQLEDPIQIKELINNRVEFQRWVISNESKAILLTSFYTDQSLLAEYQKKEYLRGEEIS